MISVFRNLTVEDKIVLLRFVAGVVFGVAVFVVSLFVSPTALSPTAWATSVLVYYITIIYVVIKYRPTSKFQVYLRGLATFYGTWLLTAIILCEVVGYLRPGA